MRTKFTLLLSALLMTGCMKFSGNKLEGSVDRTEKPIETIVYFYDTVDEVRKKYREVHKLSSEDQVLVVGFSRWPEFRDNQGKTLPDADQKLTCEIHTIRPLEINDEMTTTLGHEMLHCIIGTYHREESK